MTGGLNAAPTNGGPAELHGNSGFDGGVAIGELKV